VAIASAQEIDDALTGFFGPVLCDRAETRLENAQSCREWGAPDTALTMVAVAGLALCTLAAPKTTLLMLIGLAILVVAVTVILKLVLSIAALTEPAPAQDAATAMPAPLPHISLLVPLLREAEIAETLLRNLEALRYPRALLEVVFILEADDDVTRSTLSRLTLPRGFHLRSVPKGSIRTKPRAMNYALNFCRGEIIGIYDAEDKPEPTQLLKVARAFRTAPPNVACLQGRLDFFNTRLSLLTRCFTVEYAVWFGLQLRGLARLDLPVPLGGTTVFLKRAALDKLDHWDAHNVTEDADLGLRLHRAGYRTRLIDTVTEEEATSRIWPWIRQRSRWIKGFMITYAVHMRRPAALWRDVGPLGFATIQALFLGSALWALSMPVLLVLLASYLGLNLPGLSPEFLRATGIALLALEGGNLFVWAIGISQRRHRHLWWVLPLLHVYFLMASAAAFKALWELCTRPFFWDKTSHGHTLSD